MEPAFAKKVSLREGSRSAKLSNFIKSIFRPTNPIIKSLGFLAAMILSCIYFQQWNAIVGLILSNIYEVLPPLEKNALSCVMEIESFHHHSEEMYYRLEQGAKNSFVGETQPPPQKKTNMNFRNRFCFIKKSTHKYCKNICVATWWLKWNHPKIASYGRLFLRSLNNNLYACKHM